MRKELIKFLNNKVQAIGTIERYGLKSEYIGGDTITILLKDISIEYNNEIIKIDHAW